MRELKFRAWANGYEKWCHSIEYLGDGLWLGYIDDGIGELSTTDVIVEQYIGLKDKNSKEIYEGDIVSYLKSNYEIYFDKVQGWRGIRRGSHSIIPIGETVYNMTINQVGKPEVIGNIHENPELLSKEEE